MHRKTNYAQIDLWYPALLCYLSKSSCFPKIMESDLPLWWFVFIRKAHVVINITYLLSWIFFFIINKVLPVWTGQPWAAFSQTVPFTVSVSQQPSFGVFSPMCSDNVWIPLHKAGPTWRACSRLSVNEYPQEWYFHRCSGQPVQVPNHSQDKNLYPHNQDFPCSSLCQLPLLLLKSLAEILSCNSRIIILKQATFRCQCS